MIVAHENNECKLISHERSIIKYKDSCEKIVLYRLSEKLFNNFKIRRKRKLNDNITQNEEDQDITRIKSFLTECKRLNIFYSHTDKEIEVYKNENIQLMGEFYRISNDFNEFYGENNLNYGQMTEIGSQNYLIPPKCKFFNKPVDKIHEFLDSSEKYDYIVIDPPFKCKYIKRLKKTCQNKSYQLMSNQDIQKIPLKNYIHKTSIVVIWCTNSDIHEKFIKNELMLEWHLKLIATWKWVKIDKSGDLFCTFYGSKKPYEKIFLATHTENDKEINIEADSLIFSQPSSIHSHKPPLTDLFHHLLPHNPKCLEIFARSLYENFTSIGLECLKLQNQMLFDKID